MSWPTSLDLHADISTEIVIYVLTMPVYIDTSELFFAGFWHDYKIISIQLGSLCSFTIFNSYSLHISAVHGSDKAHWLMRTSVLSRDLHNWMFDWQLIFENKWCYYSCWSDIISIALLWKWFCMILKKAVEILPCIALWLPSFIINWCFEKKFSASLVVLKYHLLINVEYLT